MKKIICLFLSLMLLVFALCSCSGGKAQTKKIEDTEQTEEIEYPSGGIEGYWKGEFDKQNAIILFDYDGNGRMYCISGGYNFYLDLSWSVDGNRISIVLDGETVSCEYKLDGDKLMLGADSLERTDESDVPEKSVDLAEYSKSISE